MEPTTTGGCKSIGHQLVREVIYTTRKCSLCKTRCLFRTRKMVKCVACKCIMHKRCLIAVAGDLQLIAPSSEIAVPVTVGDNLVAGVPEDEDAKDTHEAQDAGDRGPNWDDEEAVQNAAVLVEAKYTSDGQEPEGAKDDGNGQEPEGEKDDGDDQRPEETKDNGDDQGSEETKDDDDDDDDGQGSEEEWGDDDDDQGSEEEWDDDDTVWLSTKLTWVGNKDGCTVVVMAKVELKLREKRHVTSVTWVVEQRLWDQLIGQMDGDPRGYKHLWDAACTVAAQAASGDKRNTPLPQDTLPVLRGYKAKTAGTRATAVAAAEDHHFRSHGSVLQMMATVIAPGHQPLWLVDNVVGPSQPNFHRASDIFHCPRFASKFVVPAVQIRSRLGILDCLKSVWDANMCSKAQGCTCSVCSSEQTD